MRQFPRLAPRTFRFWYKPDVTNLICRTPLRHAARLVGVLIKNLGMLKIDNVYLPGRCERFITLVQIGGVDEASGSVIK